MQFLHNHVWEPRSSTESEIFWKSGGGKKRKIRTQANQTSGLRIAYTTCSLVLLCTKLNCNKLANLKKKTQPEYMRILPGRAKPCYLLIWYWSRNSELRMLCIVLYELLYLWKLYWSLPEGHSTWYFLHCKTTVHIIVQTNFLMNSQEHGTSRCRAAWITRCNSYHQHWRCLWFPGSTESKPSSHGITISMTFQKKNQKVACLIQHSKEHHHPSFELGILKASLANCILNMLNYSYI